jgi:two-component system sensor histidine kinase DegS
MITTLDIFRAKILIVDDQATNVAMLEQILREAGYISITSTGVSSEVVELHRSNHYDLILLDLQMPGMDGFQVMQGLKLIETDGYIPVLVITAQRAHKLRALAAGAKDFISKPFEIGEVLVRVHNMLDVRLLHLKIKRLFNQVVDDEAQLQAEITERRQIEEALNLSQEQLSVHAGKLEGLVAVRTSELAASNRRLTASVGLVRRANHEHQALYLESEIMQRKLRQQTRLVLTAQEDERKHISRELHDEVVQSLVGLSIELVAIGKAAPATLRKKIAYTQRLVKKAVMEVHRFARKLRPAVLDDLGLVAALHAYCTILAREKKIRIHITAFDEIESFGDAARTVMFRVAQEALTNVVRHARATQVEISITRDTNGLRMEIADNGKSFSVEKTVSAKNSMHIGLLGMKERLEMVGGILTIVSIHGKGTTVRADIPFATKLAEPASEAKSRRRPRRKSPKGANGSTAPAPASPRRRRPAP